jgi:hypothetical protein
MIRSALILCAGIFVAACFACAPPPQVDASVSTAGKARPLDTCDGTDLSSRVTILSPAGLNFSLTPAMKTDLENAYCSAPNMFRHHIDSVDYIYIDASHCVGDLNHCPVTNGEDGSWGMRIPGGYTEIGIPAGIWQPNQQPAVQYTAYETAGLQYLVQQRLGAYSVPANLPYYGAASAGSALSQSWMTVLAALSHELGHVRWYAVNYRSGYGQPNDFFKLNHCHVGAASPNPGFFAGWVSQKPKFLVHSTRWRYLGEPTTDNQNDHAQSPTNNDYKNATTDSLKEQIVNSLYSTNQPWASFLAANVPEEDFVETYKLFMLTKAGLTSMPLYIPLGNGSSTTQQNLPGSLYNNGNPTLMPILADKMSCLKTVR